MEKNEFKPVLNIISMWNKIWSKKWNICIVEIITFVLSCALILCVPRYYRTEIILASESTNTLSGGLGGLAANFGFDLGGTTSQDAISPMLYPQVVKSSDFKSGLLNVIVKTTPDKDNNVFCGTYYEYMTQNHKRPWWTECIHFFKEKLRKKKNTTAFVLGNESTIKWYNREVRNLMKDLDNDILVCAVDKKTDVVTLRFIAQDPLVAATMADTVRVRLQDFITNYRTQKVQQEIEYYTEMLDFTQEEYNKAAKKYAEFADSHTNYNRASYQVQQESLRDELDIKLAALNSIQKQLLSSIAKKQEITPVYTTIQSAVIADKPAGPKRMIFVIVMCFIAGCISCITICKEDLMLLFR